MNQRIKIEKVSSIIRGQTPSNYANLEKGLAFVGQAEIAQGAKGARRYVEDVSSLTGFLSVGDIALASMDQTFRILVIDDALAGAVLGQNCLAIRIDEADSLITPHYLAAWMRTEDFRRQAIALSTGVNMPRLGPRELAMVEIPFLPLDRQEKIASLADQFREARESVRTTLSRIEELESVELELAFRKEEN
jgi:restriction endonuclease S subunit